MKKLRIGLMGAGRLGRSILRLAVAHPQIEVAAISDPASAASLAYLLQYDSILGPAADPVRVVGDGLSWGKQQIALLPGRDPGEVAWSDARVDIVIEATAQPRRRADAKKHLDRGAQRVILCVPCADPDVTLSMGINEGMLSPSHRIIAAGSPTGHAAAWTLQTLQASFGLRRAFCTQVHAYTGKQHLADAPADDLRRARAATCSIVPQPLDLGDELAALVPAARGLLSSMALHVPLANGALVDLVTYTERPVSVAAVNEAMGAAAALHGGRFAVTDDPIVSSDVKLSPLSGTFDRQATMALGEHAIKTLTWYDCSWGYAHRTLELALHLAQGGF